ncbi:MAG: ArnT family glycosyltransferase, partial [Candidatus Margulisiibacteriota bacterium]
TICAAPCLILSIMILYHTMRRALLSWEATALLLIVIFGGLLFFNSLLPADCFNKEEAQHGLYGLWIYKDLKSLDWRNFWYDTQRQIYWPFLHSWFLGLFFLLFGVSYLSARLLSFVVFLCTLFLIYWASRRLDERQGWKIGLIALVLALTSPLFVKYAFQNTLEASGALLFLVSYYFYVICQERKAILYYVPLAFLLGLSLYLNYSYAYLMLPAFLIASLGKLGPITVEAIQLHAKGEKAALPFLWWAYRKLIVLTILLLLAASWFFSAAFYRKILLLQQAIFRNISGGQISGFWQNLFYYPGVIIKEYAFSPWLGILMVFSLFLPFVALRYWRLGKLYTFIWTVLILATLTISVRAPQFIYIISPFLFMILAGGIVYFIEKKPTWLVWILLMVFLPSLFSVGRIKNLYFPPPPSEKAIQVLNYFHDAIPPRFPVAVSINLQRLNPEVFSFHFWDWNAPILTNLVVAENEMLRQAKYFFAVELDPKSPYQAEVLDDSLIRWNNLLREWLQLGRIREYSERRFESLGLTAKIYEKNR